jgi:hypothetical protein
MGLNVTEPWLAKQLQPFGIRPRNIRISGTVARGYFESDFKEAFQRYVPRSAAGDPTAEVRDQRSEEREVGQTSEAEEKNSERNVQRPEIEGPKKDETGEMPGSEAAAA